jgi:hypothetical protein
VKMLLPRQGVKNGSGEYMGGSISQNIKHKD